MKCMKFISTIGLFFGFTLLCYADDAFVPLEEARLRVFETLYQQDLTSVEQKRNFLKKNFKSTESYDIYTFPNKNIDSAYQAYVHANVKGNFADNILHTELPKTNKAFQKNSTKQDPLGYVLMYVWHGDKKLTITNTRMNDENLCTKEVLEFEQKPNATILKSNFEQYCF